MFVTRFFFLALYKRLRFSHAGLSFAAVWLLLPSLDSYREKV